MNRKKGARYSFLVLSILLLGSFILISFPLQINANNLQKISYNLPNNEKLELQKIEFFEAGYNPPPDDQLQYETSFQKSKTRYVYCKFTCKNLLYEITPHTHQVVMKYFNPDGSIRGEPKSEFHVKTEWFTCWKWHGWGWDEPGNWPPGTYRVEIWLDNEKFGADYFTIFDDTTQKTIEFLSMRFFEGGDTAPDQSLRTYATNFSKSTTRSVYTEILADNLLHDVRNHVPNFLLKYYNPDNTIMGEIKNDIEVKMDWESAYVWHGWGWDEPGNWPPGTYRVEIWIDNEKVGADYFTIFDDTTQKTIEFLSMRFFEGPRSSAPDESYRTYTTNFPKATTRSVYTEILADNLLYDVRNHVPNFLVRYYNPDNTIMGEIKNDIEVKMDWESAYIWHGWGWNEPGNWPPGTYRVEIWIDKNKAGEKDFTIFEEKQKKGLRILIDEPQMGYRVLGSSEWIKATDDEQDEHTITMESPLCVIVFSDIDSIDTDTVDEEMLDLCFSESRQAISSSTFITKKVEPFKGKPSGWYESKGALDESDIRYRQYVIIHNKKGIMITIMGFEDTWQETIPYWEDIMNNIEFIE